MNPKRQVGVLLPTAVLRRAMRRQPTYESVVEYALAAERMGIEAVLFSPRGYRLSGKHVLGIVRRDGRWVRWRGNLPRVVYNRLLSGPQTKPILQSLKKKLGPGLFNPFVSRDKWSIWKHLSAAPEVAPHLPETLSLNRKLCHRIAKTVKRSPGMVIKPRRGSLGDGIFFVKPIRIPEGGFVYRVVPARGTTRTLKKKGLQRLAYARRRQRKQILQMMISLIKYEGKRCDIRVPVQRSVAGGWNVVMPTVKQAGKHPYLTNIARGGRALSFRMVIETVFGPGRLPEIEEEVRRLSMAVAERLAVLEPGIADMGLDIGVDVDGKPWLIEVNFRDLRLVAKTAGEKRSHAQQHHNPMYYAAYLLEMIERDGAKKRG